MFYAPVTGITALHRAAQRGDEQEVATLLDEVRTCPWVCGEARGAAGRVCERR